MSEFVPGKNKEGNTSKIVAVLSSSGISPLFKQERQAYDTL